MDIKKSLIDVDDCILVIVDIQDHFLAKLSPQRAEILVDRVCWLTEIAKVLKVPIVVTVEEESRNGGLISDIAEKLPKGNKILNKTIFSLAHQKNILNEVLKTERGTAVLVGVETDVCVAQSAIGLMQKGFKVVVLSDATDSPGTDHVSGLDRIKEAGALVMNLKGLYYEWIRTVSMCNLMEAKVLKSIGHPKGIAL